MRDRWTVYLGGVPALAIVAVLSIATLVRSQPAPQYNLGSPAIWATSPRAAVTRLANTTTYTVNTGWNAAPPTTFQFNGACRTPGVQVKITQANFWSSVNPTTKLQGILWLFSSLPATLLADDATFNIAAADFANLTANQQGIAFTLASGQASGAANSGITVIGPWQAQCVGSTTLYGMVQVVNAYAPASLEVLTAQLEIVGQN